jgi:3-oxoacyl-[acyl-carrier-protein] synthase II
VPNTARRMPIRAALNNSFGFGGTNASLLMTRHDPA